MKIRLSDVRKYFIVFVLIFATDTYITFANVDEVPKLIFRALSAAIILYSVYKCKIYRKIKNGKEALVYFFFSVIVFLSALINNDMTGSMLVKIFALSFGFFTSFLMPRREFQYIFAKIIKFIALFSIVCYVLRPIILHIPGLPVLDNRINTVIFLGLCNIDNISTGIYRNWGPFWEPGVFQCYLILAVVFMMSMREKFTFRDIVICSVAIVTTLSTTGIICLFMVFLGYCFETGKVTKKNVRYGLIGVCAVLAVVIFIYNNDSIRYMIFAKLYKNNYEYISMASRTGSITANIIALMHNPFFGVGARNLNVVVENFFTQTYGNFGWGYANTNGLLMNFSMFGVFLGVPYLYLLYKYAMSFDLKKITGWILFAILLIELSSEPFVYSLVFNSMIFWKSKESKTIKEN